MSTPIFKVSDGSTITFSTQGLSMYAILARPNGQIIKGFPTLNKNPNELAYDILLNNNVVDPNSGEPLTYTVEGKQDQSNPNNKTSNLVYELPRVNMKASPDETDLNIAKTNKEILIQDNKSISQTLDSELPPEVRLTNFINSQKVTLKKRLIPFVINLITPLAPQAVPLIISNLNEDTTLDSFQNTVKEKTDESKNKADKAKNQTKDKEALKTAAIGVTTGAGANFVLGKITKDQLINLVNCPSQATIQSLLEKRNSLVDQLNGIYRTTSILTTTLGLTDIIISATQTIITIAKANPLPSSTSTVGAQTTISSFIATLENQILVQNKTLSVITISIGSFAVFLGVIIKFLNMLDIILQFCAENQNMDFKQINDEINALANSTIKATQNNDTNTYKGFTLGVKIDETNQSQYIRRYAVAQNKQGVPVLRTDSSFASDPTVLISQLKFIIDSNPNITAE